VSYDNRKELDDMECMWRRFILLKDTAELEKLIKEKELSREDLTLIFSSLDINHKAFPEIVESRKAAQKTLCQCK